MPWVLPRPCGGRGEPSSLVTLFSYAVAVVLTSTRRAPSALLVPVVDRVRDRPPMTEDHAHITTIDPRATLAPVIVPNFRNFDQLPGPRIDRSAEVSTAGNKR